MNKLILFTSCSMASAAAMVAMFTFGMSVESCVFGWLVGTAFGGKATL